MPHVLQIGLMPVVVVEKRNRMSRYRQDLSTGDVHLRWVRIRPLQGRFSMQRCSLCDQLLIALMDYLRQNCYYHYMCLCCR